MKSIKAYAASHATAPLAPHTINRRNPKENDVRIDILYCGICHSDLHTARSEWGPTLYPCVPGHEIVGRVIEIGSKVSKFKIGDTVGVGCLVDSCRTCSNCTQGLEQYCLSGGTFTYNSPTTDGTGYTLGGYSKEIVVREEFVLHVSDQLPLANVAPLLCAGITTYSPLKHWNVGNGHRIGVLGLGGLGHMAVKLAVSMGAEVTMLSTSPAKEADAKKLGAHHFVLTTDPDQMAAKGLYFDFILDTVSAAHDYNAYLSLLKTNGVMICVGAPPAPTPVHAFSLIGHRRSLVGSLIGGLPETQEMLDYCAKHTIVSDVEVIHASEINTAYTRMVKGDVRYRFVIDMSTL